MSDMEATRRVVELEKKKNPNYKPEKKEPSINHKNDITI
jgi:hypothetical protein